MKKLKLLLGLSDNQMHSLVVFIGDCTFKTEIPANVTQGISYIIILSQKNSLC